MVTDPTGEWVRYTDHLAEIARVKAERDDHLTQARLAADKVTVCRPRMHR